MVRGAYPTTHPSTTPSMRHPFLGKCGYSLGEARNGALCYAVQSRVVYCPACRNLSPRRIPLNFNRITIDPNQMNGIPCLRGLRIPVATVVGMLADGMSETEILSAYPDLEKEDIIEALRYAAEAVRERELPLIKAA